MITATIVGMALGLLGGALIGAEVADTPDRELGDRVGDWWDRLADWSASAAGVTVLLVLSTVVLLFAFLEVA